MTPMAFNLGPTELIIILVIVLLLFGGSRLAGLGKSTGRAIKEFKDETKSLNDKDAPADVEVVDEPKPVQQTPAVEAPQQPASTTNSQTGVPQQQPSDTRRDV